MTSLYEVLKAQKMGAAIASDYFTALWAGATGGGEQWETIEYTGAVPVEIYAAGEPLIDLIISGNMSQSGTPSPTTPIQPSETGDKTANLLNADTYYSGYKSGSSYTATASQFNTTIIRPFAMSDIGKTYTISCDITEISSTNVRWIATINGVSVNGDGRSNTGQIKLTFTVETENDSLRITYGSGNYTLTIAKVMMNEGSTALPYEPYGYKIPISSANTTTPVYLGEVETTRQVKKLVLTGEETITEYTGYGATNCFYVRSQVTASGGYCNTYINVDSLGSWIATDNSFQLVQSYVRIHDGRFTTSTELANYLAQQYANGTPVCVWYVLATPTTGIVNEPLRKIGNYADSLSVSQSIPTVEGENVVDVETTLKPSEIYLKYKGRSNS